MFITTQNELVSLMPTTRWDRPEQLYGYLEEEERVALEPLLGTPLYQWLCEEYVRLTALYVDITATTIKPTHQAKANPDVPYADVTERLDALQAGLHPYQTPCVPTADEADVVPASDMKVIRLIRICQQIEFYKMLSHKAGLLTVSFNEGGGMNVVSADGYDGADEKAKDRVVKDAFMSAGRAVDSLLLFLEADAKGDKLFTERWSEADAFYLHKDLLFQTARVLNEYLDIKGERMAYVQLVRDIRFCQNTYLKPRVGARLLKAVVAFANLGGGADGGGAVADATDTVAGNVGTAGAGTVADATGTVAGTVANTAAGTAGMVADAGVMEELLGMLRTALAFYVESRRTTLGPKDEKLARRDSMTDAQQAMAMACQYIEENLEAFGDAAEGTPIYNNARAREAQEVQAAKDRDAAVCRRHKAVQDQGRKKLFTAFPATHRMPELK